MFCSSLTCKNSEVRPLVAEAHAVGAEAHVLAGILHGRPGDAQCARVHALPLLPRPLSVDDDVVLPLHWDDCSHIPRCCLFVHLLQPLKMIRK